MGYSCTAYKTWDVCVCVYIYVSRQRPDFCLFGLWFARAACARLSFVLYATSSTSLLLLPFFWLLNIFFLLLFGGPVVFSLLSPFLSRGIWIWIGPACRRVEPVHSALSKGEMYQTLASSSLSLSWLFDDFERENDRHGVLSSIRGGIDCQMSKFIQ